MHGTTVKKKKCCLAFEVLLKVKVSHNSPWWSKGFRVG